MIVLSGELASTGHVHVKPPTLLHVTQSAGASCAYAALGTVAPVGCTSYILIYRSLIVSKSFEIKSRCRCSRRTWLSHEDTARKSAAGENANPDTPSVGGEVSCNRQCIHSRFVLRSVSDSDLVLATVSYLKVFLHLLTVIVVPKQKEKTK